MTKHTSNSRPRMSEMVNNVASAIEMVSLKYALRRLEGMADSDPGQLIWEEFARAAIEAMREPTGGMLKAGFKNTLNDAFDTEVSYITLPLFIVGGIAWAGWAWARGRACF